LETATTAPAMPAKTTPPDTMLSRKFLSDGDSPGDAASATSGSTSAAATAAAVSPAVSFSCTDADDARTTVILAAGLALTDRGRNDAAPSGFLSPATDRGAATADRDAVAAMACVLRGCVAASLLLGLARGVRCVGDGMVGAEKVKVGRVEDRGVPGRRGSPTWGALVAPSWDKLILGGGMWLVLQLPIFGSDLIGRGPPLLY
jgi:hypothetical protein